MATITAIGLDIAKSVFQASQFASMFKNVYGLFLFVD